MYTWQTLVGEALHARLQREHEITSTVATIRSDQTDLAIGNKHVRKLPLCPDLMVPSTVKQSTLDWATLVGSDSMVAMDCGVQNDVNAPYRQTFSLKTAENIFVIYENQLGYQWNKKRSRLRQATVR